jgi:cytochrome P450
MLGSLRGDPESLAAAAVAFGEFDGYARAMIAARRASPTDDLVSVLVHADVDGTYLADDEIVMESLLLLVGGDETTRHVTVGGTEQLLAEPATKARLLADPALLPTAVEEMLRWVTPIKNMARTTTREVELEGIALTANVQLVVLYESANFDAAQFTARAERPSRLRLRRALLPRGEPGPPRARRDVRATAGASSRPRARDRRAPAPHHQRRGRDAGAVQAIRTGASLIRERRPRRCRPCAPRAA